MARRQHVSITHAFAFGVGHLFAHLAEHENMARLFAPARVRRLGNGTVSRNGVGSTRLVQPGPLLGFVEPVTDYRPNALIEYRITRGGPLRHHLGRMRFAGLPGGGSRLDYDIWFEGRFPGAGPVFAMILRGSIARGLNDLAVTAGPSDRAG